MNRWLWRGGSLASSLLCSAAFAQQVFVDDAQRRVSLPSRVERVFAAGAPAEVLLYTLVPDKLAGRNQIPPPAALFAGSLDAAPRRPLTVAEIRDLAPDVIVAASSAAAAAIRTDPPWQGVSAVAAG